MHSRSFVRSRRVVRPALLLFLILLAPLAGRSAAAGAAAFADCNGNGVDDAQDIADGTSGDCTGNGIPDECDIADGRAGDCNGNAAPDECDLRAGVAFDCDENGLLDECEIASGLATDCNGNSVPDACEIASGASTDCNGNGLPDSCDVAEGTSTDCDANGVPDECGPDCDRNGQPDACDIALGIGPDCNANGVPDSCDLSGGFSGDCDGNGVPDECDIAGGTGSDCNSNLVPDACDISEGTSTDCDANGIPDDCDLAAGRHFDCNSNGLSDVCDIADGTSGDCTGNGIPDECDIAAGRAADCNSNGAPDECDIRAGVASDCNGNGVLDECEIALGLEEDCDGDGVPDSCEISAGTALDCNRNGVPDSCEIADGTLPDCDRNGQPDECDIALGISPDCDANGLPDSCDLENGASDCNENGIPDSCDLASGEASDCNGNGILDGCDLAAGTSGDCTGNGVPDECDIADGREPDCNGNGAPDACDLRAGVVADCNLNAVPDECEIASGAALDANGDGVPDDCQSLVLERADDYETEGPGGWAGMVATGEGETSPVGGLCMTAPGPGDNVMGWVSPERYVELVDRFVYRAEIDAFTDQTDADAIPFWVISCSNFNSDGSGNNYGGQIWFMDVGGGASGIGRPQGRATFQTWFSPNAMDTMQWRGLVDPDQGAFTVANDASNDMRFDFRVFDNESASINAILDQGTICIRGLRVDRTLADLLAPVAVRFDAPILAVNYAAQTFGEAADMAGTARIDDATETARYQLAASGPGARKTLLPYLQDLAGADTDYDRLYPVRWESDRLYKVTARIEAEGVVESGDPVDVIGLAFDNPTNEIGVSAVSTRGAPNNFFRTASPRLAATTGGAAQPYVAWFHSNNESVDIAIDNSHSFRALAWFLNNQDLAPDGSGTDPFAVRGVTVEEVALPAR